MHSDVCSNVLEVNWAEFVIRAVLPDTVIYIYKAEYFIRSHFDFLMYVFRKCYQIILPFFKGFLRRWRATNDEHSIS